MTTFRHIPLDGSVLLPEFIDFHLTHNPTYPAYVYAEQADGPVVEISRLEFGRACHRVAKKVRPSRQEQANEIVAIIANTDTLLYQALTMGVIQSGLISFPISQRNSAVAIISMLQTVSCHRLLISQDTLQDLVEAIHHELAILPNHYDLVVEDIPSLSEIFPKLGKESAQDPFEAYPPSLGRPKLESVVLYLHSSGSTGFPKAIKQSNKSALDWMNFPGVSAYRESDLRVAVMHLPPFHTFAILYQLYIPLAHGCVVSLYPPTSFSSKSATPVIPTSANILEHIKWTGSKALGVVPSFLEEWSLSSESIDVLKSLQVIVYGGGPLAMAVGDKLLREGVNVYAGYAGTEFGGVTEYNVNTKKTVEDWSWMKFSDRVRPRWIDNQDGTYELEFITTDTHQPSVENLSDIKGYATQDVFEKHPSGENLWRAVGRADSVIIMANGEKVVPDRAENRILASPWVKGALMFGRERTQVGILLEPRDNHVVDLNNENQVAEFRNAVWPHIEDANKSAPAFARIFKEAILITDKEKPMLRAPKGTVMRKMTLKAYKTEIDNLYKAMESSALSSSVEPPKSWAKADVQAWLSREAEEVLVGKTIKTDVDLFEQGFDSLSATYLRNRLKAALTWTSDPDAKRAVAGIAQNYIFANPTIDRLAESTSDLVAHPHGGGPAPGHDTKEILAMILKYTTGLTGKPPVAIESDAIKKKVNLVVLLTGSTGGLGSHLLASLLTNETVSTVYAFNRPSRAESTLKQRQMDAFADRGIPVALVDSPKLVFVEGDAASELNLGLDKAIYEKIRDSITVIIHNAWRLDFNLALSSFEQNVRATRHLIDLGLASPHAASLRFMFTSSIGSAQGWDYHRGPFPEEVQLDAAVAVGTGYGESKYVAERILARSGLQGTSFRIGQVCGSPNGCWATTDWVPILIKSSVSLGALPDACGLNSWIPMAAVSDTIMDVILSPSNPTIALNVSHPRPSPWTAVMTAVSSGLVKQNVTPSPLSLVPFAEWLSRLEKRAENPSDNDLKTVPAIKLLDFFRALSATDTALRKSIHWAHTTEGGLGTVLGTDKAQTACPTMAHLSPLEAASDMDRWIAYWHEKQLFS